MRNPPLCEFVYEAIVDIADVQNLGQSLQGQRFIVNILGGEFSGPLMKGRVLPGGADRQLLRPDGVKELDALYEMQADDGTVITVHNQVVVDMPNSEQRYARSVVKFRAPAGQYEWLNRRVFVGTLESLKPAKNAVKITVFQLN
ncbi:MAG: hypothetical protein RLZZ433_2441 [Pseudomonadota bacterium]|jgi:hypothetical protein